MADSIARKALLIALAVAFPSVFAIYLCTADSMALVASLVAAALLVLVSWLVARALTGRVNNLLNRHYQNPDGFDQPTFGAFAGIKAAF